MWRHDAAGLLLPQSKTVFFADSRGSINLQSLLRKQLMAQFSKECSSSRFWHKLRKCPKHEGKQGDVV